MHLIVLLTGKSIITTHKCPEWMQDHSFRERFYGGKKKSAKNDKIRNSVYEKAYAFSTWSTSTTT
jgi:hypothetical protein